ncbi:HPr family phosphocarrier protein [Mycoplasmatota bacterium WC30]
MEKTITINNTEGLHAQLANKLVQVSNKFDVDVRLEYENVTIDARSILGLMSLAVPKGKNVKVVAEGDDALIAIAEVEKILG